FLVHGRAGTFDVMWAVRRCLPERCNILAPQAPEPDILGGYSWWDVESLAASPASAAQAWQVLSRFMANARSPYGLSPLNDAALGFSQGAGILSLLLQRTPDAFSAIALLAGCVIPEPDAPSSPSYPAVLMAYGSDDDIVPIPRAEAGRDYH